MRLRPYIRDPRDLRKFSYGLLRICRELSRGRKAPALLAAKLKGDPAVCAMLRHLRKVLEMGLPHGRDDVAREDVLRSIDILAQHVRERAETGSLVDLTFVANVEKAHTQLLGDNQFETPENEALQGPWRMTLLAALVAWGDRLDVLTESSASKYQRPQSPARWPEKRRR